MDYCTIKYDGSEKNPSQYVAQQYATADYDTLKNGSIHQNTIKYDTTSF